MLSLEPAMPTPPGCGVLLLTLMLALLARLDHVKLLE
jgi:hypothetical protein